MSEEKRGELTLGQQRFMERMQEAQKEGVSLTDYYRAHGLSMAMLYKVRRQLVQKGIVLPTRPQPGSGLERFVQVRLQESLEGAELSVRGPVCRLRQLRELIGSDGAFRGRLLTDGLELYDEHHSKRCEVTGK